jgi:hypothetical protein
MSERQLPRRAASHPSHARRLYVLTSVVGVGGYLGGLMLAVRLEETVGDLLRGASITFFLVMGVVRERFTTSGGYSRRLSSSSRGNCRSRAPLPSK